MAGRNDKFHELIDGRGTLGFKVISKVQCWGKNVIYFLLIKDNKINYFSVCDEKIIIHHNSLARILYINVATVLYSNDHAHGGPTECR